MTKKDFVKAHQETKQRFEKMDQNFTDLFEVISDQFQKVDER